MTVELPRWIKLTPFTSLNALHEEHQVLRRENENIEQHDFKGPSSRRDVVLLRRRIRRFEERVAATGQILDEHSDRELVQSLLDYWSIRQAYLAREAERLRLEEANGAPRVIRRAPPLPEPLALAPFDEEQAPALPDEPSPFVGLNAFTELEAARAFFHGRSDAVRELTELVAEHRLLVVTGPSGGGKSSLVMAGLIPALRNGALPGSTDWAYWPAVLPGTDPFAGLLNAVRPPQREPMEWIAEQRAKLETAPTSLPEVCLEATGGPRPSFIVLDQTEELLTLTRDEQIRERLMTGLVSLAHAPAPEHHVIVIIREDFLAYLRKLKPLAELSDDSVVTYRPKPMTAEELRLAIEEPARAVGLKFDPGIVDDLVRSVVNDPAALPLLEFTLTQLWRRRRRNRITFDTYEKIGRPAEALERTAERVFANLSTQENQDAARALFLALVVPAASANEPQDNSEQFQIVSSEWVRRRLPRALLHQLQASGRIDLVLDAFVKEGLIRKTPGIETGEDRFDVSHEALLRNWRRLREWLFQKRSESEHELQVLTSARQWDQSGCNPDHLAVGTALEEAEKYTADPLINAYVQASRKAEIRKEERTRIRQWILALAIPLIALVAGGVAFGISYWTKQVEIQAAAMAAKKEAEREVGARIVAVTAEAKTVQDLTQSELLNADVALHAAPDPPPAPVPGPSTAVSDGPGTIGYFWVGSSATPLLRDASGKPVTRPIEGQSYRLRVNVALRDRWPLQNPFSPGDRMYEDAAATTGALLVVDKVRPFDAAGGKQYWMKARLVPEVVAQHPPGAGGTIKGILSDLRKNGYETASPEEIQEAEGLAEIRYYHRQDREPAADLAGELESILKKRIEVKPFLDAEDKAHPGVLELWLDPKTGNSRKG